MIATLTSIFLGPVGPDPRLRCEADLEVSRPVIEALLERGAISPVEAEHTAVVSGQMIEKYRGARTLVPRVLAHALWGTDVLVAVKPSGHPVVFAVEDNGDLTSRGPRVDREVRVHVFRNDLRAGASAKWSWRNKAPGAIEVGDVRMGEFMDRAEPALRELMRINSVRVDDLRLGRVLRGSYRMRTLDVLIFPVPEDNSTGILIFDATTGEVAPLEEDIDPREFIFLKNGQRMKFDVKVGWYFLPSLNWIHDSDEIGRDPAMLAFIDAYPTAMNDLLFQSHARFDIDFAQSRVEIATDELTDEQFLAIIAPSGTESTYFLFDVVTDSWADQTALGMRTFRLENGLRLGLNLVDEGFQRLPPVGEFERARALFTSDDD